MKHSADNIFIICIVAVLLISCAVPVPVRVEGTAMLPAFKDGDKIIMAEGSGEIARGDVIMFHYPMDETRLHFKRVIALPGERIEIREGKTMINGLPIEEPYLDQTYNQQPRNFPEVTIAADNYFVMGDNRDNSSDSRSWGTVRKELVTGKYFTTYSKSEK
jgi:signal peptidase I